MRWCRFVHEGFNRWGLIQETRVQLVTGDPFSDHKRLGTSFELSQVRLLPPTVPTMIYAAGPNYRGHVVAMAQRRGRAPVFPTRPEPNFRLPQALIGHESPIVVPADSSGAVQPEGQLAVVIGRDAHRVPLHCALDHVLGCTIGNDVTERVWQEQDRTMFRSKNSDTFKPLGPWIDTEVDAASTRVTVRINGAVSVEFVYRDQTWDIATWIHEISRHTRLFTGDVLLMGSDSASGDMHPGDVVEVAISGIGCLRNPVTSAQPEP